MTIERAADLEEGRCYQLPTALIVRAWRRSPDAPFAFIRENVQLTWWLLGPDRIYVIPEVLPSSDPAREFRSNSRGEIRLWLAGGKPAASDHEGAFGTPTPYTVRDLLPLGEAG